MITVASNFAAMNIQRQLGVNTRKDKKNVERLSSGFRINRAADDAAGLVISEKMRQQIRGLNQGTENAQDGVSWVQIGDGALDEVHDMLHRMTELSVQSLNETYTDADRAAMEAEFNHLQSQIDNISQNTQFNTKEIFSKHEPTFYQVEGNLVWPHDQVHDIYSPNNTLVVSYREKNDDPPVSVTISVPEGSYTTQELADELEDAIATSPLAYHPKLNFEYTQKGTFNANLEGGVRIESVDGALSSLLNKAYQGGSTGALIGTTVFKSDSARLKITTGQNDSMTFDIEDFSGRKITKSITLPSGQYTRNQLIDLINNRLVGTGVAATKYGTGIMLSGDDRIISRFKGNMFKIDGPGNEGYTSVFYDNVYHGAVSLTPGTFTGGAVLPSSSYSNGRDAEHRFFDIKTGVNDTLTFKPNGSDTPITVTIPEKRYEIGDMVNTLNSLFSSNGLALTASSYQSNNFTGIKITSQLKGATSDVGLSPSSSDSSAYNTLFVEKKYNTYESLASVYNESTLDRSASFNAQKQFNSTYYKNLPLTITSGENDKFSLTVDGVKHEIVVPYGTYTNAGAVVSAINNGLTNAGYGTAPNKITASANTSGQISLTSDISSGIVSLNASGITGNNGFADLFTRSYRYTEKNIISSSATLDRVFPNPTDISESEKYIVVESPDGNHSYTIELPTGSVSHNAIKAAVESSNSSSKYTDIKYTHYPVNGQNRNFSNSGSGTTTYSTAVYSNTGVTVSTGIEGQVGDIYTTNTPATVTIPLKSTFTPATGSDSVQLTLNTRTEVFTFDHKAYTPATFASELQQKIDSAFGSYFGGATVEVSGTGIKITSRLNDEHGEIQRGDETSIRCDSSNSSLLRTVNATQSPASITTPTNRLLPSSGINVSDGDTFEFTLNNERKSVSLTSLTNASGSSFAAMLNNCLKASNIPVTAKAVSYGSGYRLQLTTDRSGNGNSISYNSTNGGTVTEKIFGDLETSGYAIAQNIPVKQNITIAAGKNAFRYSVDGNSKKIDLTPGDYTRDKLLEELNSKLIGVTASLTNDQYLKLTSISEGSSSSVDLTYDAGNDSAMRAIWGQNEIRVPKLHADFDQGNHLVLTSDDGTQFRIRSSGTSFVEQNVSTSTSNPTVTSGYYSTNHAYIDGRDLNISASSPLVIDEWNDTLKFNYYKDSSSSAKSIEVAHVAYTSYDQLRSELQSKLDTEVGSGELNVTVDQHGVRIEAAKAGSTRQFGSVSGDFYDKVMNRATENTASLSTSKTVGSNVASTDKLPYVIGRRNVKDNPVKIKADINDTLALDFTYTDQGGVKRNKTFTMKLDEGTFQGSSLTSMIQEKLNEQLRANGLSENLIEVGIGGTNAVVAGVNNDKVLTFKLSNTLPLPSSGEYIIDGIGGNAAFSVFYQTTGELVPAYVEGVKNITEGVVIEDQHNNLTFSVDNRSYSLDIPTGEYTGDQLISQLNSLLSGQNAPVKAELSDDGSLKLSHKQMGNHPITDLSGSARGSIFFNEYSGEDEDRSILIQFSSQLNDNKTIDRPPMSTAFLGINSVTISKTKYAAKALGRIQGALDKVSEVRSYFGATQNAIEHVINRNNITSENTQAAESLLRDTDMAQTMVDHSMQSILIQAGQAMLSQANINTQNILQLLQ